MKLIREIPRSAQLVAVGADLFGNFLSFYICRNQKYCKISHNDRSKCYKGQDCF